jgi:hypothetical protein
MLSECPFKHCFICGEHDCASGNYCKSCVDGSYEDVKKDAEIRGLSRDNRDHRFWAYGHDITLCLSTADSRPPFYGMCKLEAGHDSPHMCW